ncbi:tRNA pseudouridine55 synthase [Blastomyces silverae]|uniref:tRNA pseudouridine55 synthase n=1 Tax=Blastomyces silverae TaxID=2060906 RepID=A0A0H1B9Y0_9EURO|nr:tRNA pseudouridine55 synthase [Blastomyces silverae]
MSSLVRTRQGDFTLEPGKVLEYRDLEAGEEVWGPKLQGFLDEWAERKGERKGNGASEGVSEGTKEGTNEEEREREVVDAEGETRSN